ncbi:MAG: hypothetical protein F7B11_03520 [Caldisphaeraceae archaeon]|nr:hypothetical protein [Caldisphaeraceae archaeon]
MNLKKGEKVLGVIVMLLVSLFLLFPLASPIAKASQGGWSRSTWVYLPAVVGTNKGAVINTTITLSYPGSGEVSVTSNGTVQPSTIYSMKMAFIVAMLYSGLNYRDYNLKIFINASGTISGPSGSFGVMLATYGLANGLNTTALHKFTITGAVSPSGLSGPIGGLQEKCMAASKNNLTIAFPVGNLISSGVGFCKRYVPIPGIIAGIEKIYKSTPYRINISIGNNTYFNVNMRKASLFFINRTKGILNAINQTMAYLPNQTLLKANVYELINNTKTDIHLAYKDLNDTPYASASYAFTSYYDALTVNYTIWLYRISKNGTTFPTAFIIKTANKIINKAENLESKLINYSNVDTLYGQELLSVAFSRIADTIYNAKYLESLVKGTPSISLSLAAQNLAYINARLDSASSWADAAISSASTPPYITPSLIKTTALSSSTFAGTAISYADSLIEYYIKQFISIGNVEEANQLNAMKNNLNFLLTYANSLLKKGYYTAAIGIYEDALQNSLNIIFIVIGTSYPVITNSYTKELQNEFNLISSQLASRGLESSIDGSYMSYAKQIAKKDPASALNIMEIAVIDSLIWYMGELALNGGNISNYVYVSSNPFSVAFEILYLIIGISLGILIALTFVIRGYRKAGSQI